MSIHVAGRGGAGRGGAAVGDFPVLENVYPTSPPLIFGIGSLNTKWGILYLHQYAERRLLVKHFRHTLGALDGVFIAKRSRNKRFSCKRV